ncbi:hypothetical protein ACIQWN_32235 [Streptomyces vinaceus]|uniref:hypothetical protein n=1 Tax=Streptomyces vinaceus TaxID=1960 RepID=UPI00380251D3
MSQLPPPTRTARPPQAQTDEFDDGPFTFRPATKDGQKARLSLQGPSGCGKTWTGLQIAAGFAEGRKFAVIDTERGAASLYLDDIRVPFDTLPMRSYDPRNLINVCVLIEVPSEVRVNVLSLVAAKQPSGEEA